MCMQGLKDFLGDLPVKLKSWQSHASRLAVASVPLAGSRNVPARFERSIEITVRLRADFCRLICGVVLFADGSVKFQPWSIAIHYGR